MCRICRIAQGQVPDVPYCTGPGTIRLVLHRSGTDVCRIARCVLPSVRRSYSAVECTQEFSSAVLYSQFVPHSKHTAALQSVCQWLCDRSATSDFPFRDFVF